MKKAKQNKTWTMKRCRGPIVMVLILVIFRQNINRCHGNIYYGFTLQTKMQSKIPYDILKYIEPVSVIECIVKCKNMYGDSCISSFYNMNGLKCAFSDMAFTNDTNDGEPGWDHYLVNEHVPSPPNPADYLGSLGGAPFTDEDFWNGHPVTGFRVQCGHYVYSIQMKYGEAWGPSRGDFCNATQPIITHVLEKNEVIQSLTIRFDDFVTQLIVSTNIRTFPACGGGTGQMEKTVVGTRLLYIDGRMGCVIDGIQPVWAKE